MATTTNPYVGSSSAAQSNDRVGLNSSSNRYGLTFKQSDEAFGLFEELLSLPILDSTLVATDGADQPPTGGSSTEAQNKSVEEERDDDDDKLASEDNRDSTATSPVNVVVVQSQVIDEQKPVESRKTENATATQSRPEPVEEATPVSLDKSNDSNGRFVAQKETDQSPKPEQKIQSSSREDSQTVSEPIKYASRDVKPESSVTKQIAPATVESSDRIAPAQITPIESAPDIQENTTEDKAAVDAEVTKVSNTDNENLVVNKSNDATSPEKRNENTSVDSISNEEDDLQPAVQVTSSRRAEHLNDRRRDARFEEDSEGGESSQGDEPYLAPEQTYSSLSSSDASSGIIANASIELGGLESLEAVPQGVTSSSNLSSTTPLVTAQSVAITASAVTSSSNISSSAGNTTPASSGPATNSTNSSGSGIIGSATTNGSLPSSSTPTSSLGTSGSTGLTKYQEQRVLQRALAGIEQLQDGSSPVRIRLHPPELGSLQVTVKIENSQLIAAIEVEHTAAKQVLLENLPKLQASLKEQGITIADFRVEVVPTGEFSGTPTGSFAQQQGQFRDGSSSSQSSRYASIARNRLEQSPVGAAHDGSAPVWTRRDGNLDVNM